MGTPLQKHNSIPYNIFPKNKAFKIPVSVCCTPSLIHNAAPYNI
jgi:hypothetical protein